MASNVNLIDPNNIANNGNPHTNGIPQYQDMYIFAELTAKSRGRTVLITTNDGNNTEGTFKTGLEKSKSVNFLGVNQNINDPNYLNFTTNYYDGSTPEGRQYESFGINNIKVVVNSSFIPQVNIQFVDIRGLSFFNQNDSPYRMLFDFPPPTFELSIKGYYGKILKYKLHLVKYTSEFQSESGNFIIDAQFVAVTFAPLSDVLFRYIVNVATINKTDSLKSSSNSEPSNTYELILKLRDLYSNIAEKVKAGTEVSQFENIEKQIEDIDLITSMINEYKEDPSIQLIGQNNVFLVTRKSGILNYVVVNNSVNTDNNIMNKINLTDFDNILKTGSLTGNRLYLITPLQYNEEISLIPSPEPFKNPASNIIEPTKNFNLKYNFNLFRKKLTNRNIGIKSKISDAEFNNYYSTTTNKIEAKTTKYIGLDLTDYYIELYKIRGEQTKNKEEVGNKIISDVNELIIENLGMMPTIYNIFKIILKDVDTFFDTLRTTSIKAQELHNQEPNKSIILGGSYKDNSNEIFAFPLIVDIQSFNGGKKEERIAPIELNKKVGFPEIKLVNDFIKSFFDQKKYESLEFGRDNKNEDGTNQWFPLSPADSKIGSDDSSSPYTFLFNARTDSDNNQMINQILTVVLNRYYVLTQGIYPYRYKNITNYVNFFAESEGINLGTSLSNSQISNNVRTFFEKYKNNIDSETGFFNYLSKNVNNYSEDTNDSILIAGSNPIYLNRANPEFTGAKLYPLELTEQTIDVNSDNPISKFMAKFNNNNAEGYYNFCNENLIYISDIEKKSDGAESDENVIVDDVNVITRFLTDIKTDFKFGGAVEYYPSIDDLLAQGNSALRNLKSRSGEKKELNKFQDITGIWIDFLTKHDEEIKDEIILSSSKLSALFLLSNFGHTIGMYSIYPKSYNALLFSESIMIQVPEFLPLYIGALIDAKENGWFVDIENFFTTGDGKDLINERTLIFADYSDIDKYMSENEKEMFKTYFQEFYIGSFSVYEGIRSSLENLYKESGDKEDKYKKQLSTTGGFYKLIILPLIQRTNLAVFSEITFSRTPIINDKVNYVPLSASDRKALDKSFFETFMTNLITNIKLKENENIKAIDAENKIKNDKDIITQTYYSFKNINDKWLTNPTENNITGYPQNRANKSLISQFAFVDRAMNPVGDTMINCEILLDLFNDPNISVFSVLSQLLSLNGFEFFPIQNFMSHSDDTWNDSFKIDVSNEIDNRSAFVCMYIGGSSSYPSTGGNGFEDDGITDFDTTDVTDFNGKKNNDFNPDYDSQTLVNDNFPFRNVRAFTVKFGEQNQSMFTNIKIDSKEYPETNESIQILSRLAGDNNTNATVPKGQNLYNLYENRSYKATITGLGNAMIQPTQYFQLENVPMFNGAYIILSVEHNIAGNKMTTSFSGTKILKYPYPRVTTPFSFLGIDGLNNISNLSSGDFVTAVLLSDNKKTQYNSMYDLKIE